MNNNWQQILEGIIKDEDTLKSIIDIFAFQYDIKSKPLSTSETRKLIEQLSEEDLDEEVLNRLIKLIK